uniref:C2H2-type domain-containing protein n=1 Tax=Amphora coffeiformis TaxID=265554 RepID=A0A7S3LEQ8_9STRA|eukprot:scaffold638_cov168-Amphora_coffeaeformis.AAC.37
MPKAEKGSVKDIGKRIKSKGLQKLKFWCQMCEKQCRDANGFKCHLQSESHLRQMKIFSENASGIMDSYSKEFEKCFMDTLRMRHGTTKMMANRVYQEVIQDKHHIHMNSTIWASLSDFCKYLGKTGKCVVEETERGWFVTYIERDVAKLQRDEALQRRLQAEQAAEKAALEQMERQRRNQAELASAKMEEVTGLQRKDDDPVIKVALQTNNATKLKRKGAPKLTLGFGDDDEDDHDGRDFGADKKINPDTAQIPDPDAMLEQSKRAAAERQAIETKKRQAEEAIEKQKFKKTRTKEKVDEETWLYKGIVVRIINQELAGGKYFRRKAVVDRLVSSFTAELTVLEPKEGKGDEITGDVLKMDQEDLETVVPKQSGVKVRILRGPHRGEKAKVKSIDKANFTARLKVDDTYLENIDFADFAQID